MSNLQYIFELLGTLLFAISGALAVRDHDADLFGATFTGFVTAIGGGTLRDIMLGSYPLTWISDIRFLYAIMLGALVSYLFFKSLVRLSRTFLFFDALGISLFTILGVEKALSLGVRPEIAAIMGMFSAVMGGVIRDTLINETPVLFRKEIYATACLSGAVLYLVLNRFEVDRDVNLIVSSALIFVVRMVALRFKLTLPNFKR
ncbi:MAG: trimeric intracellular cation channel family protein [Cyclobacteriaceae bacterium]|nr:trimeric intracellular cation channel family protein [Cyclobacteriaceae bacterium]